MPGLIEAATAGAVHGGGEGIRGWKRRAPQAAVAWSVVYAALGIYWMVSGRGFPYGGATDIMTPVIGRFGPGVAWIAVIMAGIPAAAVAAAMLRGAGGRVLRPFLLTCGTLIGGTLLLLMTALDLLIKLGYTPYALLSLFSGAKFGRTYLESLIQWTAIHQFLCLAGGFLWLAATVCYARRSRGACLNCGRGDDPESWQSPDRAARWTRIAVYVAMVAPVFYAFTRYAWLLGINLGNSHPYVPRDKEHAVLIAGAFLATFALAGASVMLGLVQRWGEEFPHWMIGLAGRRVPIAMAVIPAALVSVLLIVGGIAVWSSLGGMIAKLTADGVKGMRLAGELFAPIGPVLLFPVWGGALAVATLGYYFRRRGPCGDCGRGA